MTNNSSLSASCGIQSIFKHIVNKNRNCRASHPVPSCPVRSLTRPLPVPYPSLTSLASPGLLRSHKGTGTDTIFDFRPPPPPLNFLEAFIVPSCTPPIPVPYLSLTPSPHRILPLLYQPPLHNPSLTCPLPIPYPSLTYPLPFPYQSLTHPLLLHY